MFKSLRKLFSTDTPEELINSSLFMRSDEVDLETFMDYIYDTDKFSKWFNFFPIIWLKFDKKHFDVGCVGTIRFACPPFYYRLKVVKVIPNQSFECIGVNGLLKGRASMKFTVTKEGITFEDPHYLSGINMLVHKYYSLFLAPNHVPYMKWRYKILRKMLLKEMAEKKGKLPQ